MFEFVTNLAKKVGLIVQKDLSQAVDDKALLEREIMNWKNSPERFEAMQGELYYDGYHDILYKKRTAIGKGGKLVEIDTLPNNHDIDNQYGIAVDKKASYFLGRPLSFVGENEQYIDIIRKIFDATMMKKLKNLAKKSMNGGLAWILPYYDESGKLKFRTFPAYEILPMWADAEHEVLNSAVRLYTTIVYEGKQKKTVEHVELYKKDGVYRYILTDGGSLKPEEHEHSSYAFIDGTGYNWSEIPLICFKYNEKEIPLIRRVKGLQDAINELLSMYHNNMLEDSRNTILIIKNYDGQDLGEFRNNLATFGAVKVRTIDGADGGVEALHVEVNSENYKVILQMLKDALIENARSFNGKMLNSGTPNQMNILSMYQDIDLDTNDFEGEYQSAIEKLLYFINVHLKLTGQGDFLNEEVQVIFNRDMMMNESEIMATLTNAGVKISNKTLLSQVPFIDDVDAELDQIKAENDEAMEIYNGAFNSQNEAVDEE